MMNELSAHYQKLANGSDIFCIDTKVGLVSLLPYPKFLVLHRDAICPSSWSSFLLCSVMSCPALLSLPCPVLPCPAKPYCLLSYSQACQPEYCLALRCPTLTCPALTLLANLFCCVHLTVPPPPPPPSLPHPSTPNFAALAHISQPLLLLALLTCKKGLAMLLDSSFLQRCCKHQQKLRW